MKNLYFVFPTSYFLPLTSFFLLLSVLFPIISHNWVQQVKFHPFKHGIYYETGFVKSRQMNLLHFG